jgi:GAF domain-containing protein
VPEALSRRTRILELLFPPGTMDLPTAHLGRVCADVTGATGAGIVLIADDGPVGTVVATDRISALLEELQFSLGEGPCIDAHRDQRPALEPDLARPEVARWVAFTPPAVAAGACAVFGYPVGFGDVHLGSLDLYRDAPGPMSGDEHANALVVAELAAQVILRMQDDAAPGTVAAAIEGEANFHYVVHQAVGMVAAQIEVDIDHAMARLRGYAFGNGLALTDVARSVVSRRLRFSPEPEDPS